MGEAKLSYYSVVNLATGKARRVMPCRGLADDTEAGKHAVTDISNGDELEREKKYASYTRCVCVIARRWSRFSASNRFCPVDRD